MDDILMKATTISEVMPCIDESMGKNTPIELRVCLNEYASKGHKIVNVDERSFKPAQIEDGISCLFDLDVHGWAVQAVSKFHWETPKWGWADIYTIHLERFV